MKLSVPVNSDSPIFLDRDVFGKEYTPNSMQCRRKELVLMNLSCKSLVNKRTPRNIVISGGKATGKTTALSWFLKFLKSEYRNVKTVYINCKSVKSKNDLFAKIYKDIYRDNIKYGITTTWLFEKINAYLIYHRCILIIALDDMDDFKNQDELNDFIGLIVKSYEIDSELKISLIMVSNTVAYCLSPDVKSDLMPSSVHFEKYTYEQIYHILKERCDLGFLPSVIDNEVIKEIAKLTYEKNDLRYGISILQGMGDLAEIMGESKILLNP